MRRPISAVLSVALHSCIAAAVLVSCQERQAKVQPKVRAPSERVMQVEYLKEAGNGFYRCESTYDGIGMGGMDDVPVWDVQIHGPMWRAGVRVGDVLRGIDGFYPGKLPVGTILPFQKLINGKWTAFTVMVEEICRR